MTVLSLLVALLAAVACAFSCWRSHLIKVEKTPPGREPARQRVRLAVWLQTAIYGFLAQAALFGAAGDTTLLVITTGAVIYAIVMWQAAYSARVVTLASGHGRTYQHSPTEGIRATMRR